MIVIKHYDMLTKSELYAILKLRNEVFIVEQTCPYQDIDMLDQKSYHAYYKKNDEIIGYARLIDPNVVYPNSLAIGRVLVKHSYRNQGYAKKLMRKLMSFAFETYKETRITISAQSHLLKFYQTLGFKKISDPYLEDNIPHVKMIIDKKK
ncbi:MAG: GNAT family N-acetyltransferase [Candidatus Izimaplasma sp.]|nr:GNAT family N-acetyltransferase [Candidatus Izimaplasma bacterium]